MKQWEIYLYPFTAEGSHPAVIISNDERCDNPHYPHVNALLCTTLRAARPAKKNEVILNGSDGLDWPTAVRCDVIYLLPKNLFQGRRGEAARERRRAIGRKIMECYRLMQE
ncbi:MAG: Transcriptional modulator of MazE/toxin, MazF [Prosthecobacter sp.]|nr:Transcriptional modulator of MazE/toxin, MazF [Prosthecobacter sp.]